MAVGVIAGCSLFILTGLTACSRGAIAEPANHGVGLDRLRAMGAFPLRLLVSSDEDDDEREHREAEEDRYQQPSDYEIVRPAKAVHYNRDQHSKVTGPASGLRISSSALMTKGRAICLRQFIMKSVLSSGRALM